MAEARTTCWTMIEAAAAGSESSRQAFALRYEPVARAYLAARWRGRAALGDLDDAVQEVFVESFRNGGALEKADRGRAGGFRPFFFGVVRNVAMRCEARRSRRRETSGDSAVMDAIEHDEPRLTQVFNRAYAQAVMREAAAAQEERAREQGDEAMRRVELLRLRFHEGLPIRDIAARWNEDPVYVHRAYALARREFRRALEQVVSAHHAAAGGGDEMIRRECEDLLRLLA